MATWSSKSALHEMQLGATGDMTVVERLQYLLDTGQFADINIRVGQGNNAALFKAHRLLLATASQPLYRLVQQGVPSPGTADMFTLRITDIKPADFESILKYIYTDRVECENINVAFGLLRASRKWGLAGLGIKSLTYLEEFVDTFTPSTDEAKNNLFDLLALSEDTLADLNSKCYQIILKHAEELIPCHGYLNLDKAMVEKVLCHPNLKIEDQLKLFEAIRDWGLHYLEQQNLPLSALGSAVEEIIKVVDFEKITDADFLGTVLTSECLGKAEVIAFFMTHGLEIPRKLDFNNNKELPFWLTFCATSGKTKGGTAKGAGRISKRSSISSSSSSPSSLAPVSEGLNSICSLTQNGAVMEFNKVCRFKKGYRCQPNEIYMQHELRFRVDKNVKLLGVSFGFLFTPTDMGLNIHCQGPWETRQWTDIIQSYVRVSGEKQETADVRLMFLHPVRIEANQSYKVVVKMVRMSHGSNEVELWGGTGGVRCVETEDAEFHFIKAAVDPDKPVEESDGDTAASVITALLYRLDTDEPDPDPAPVRRRRPVQAEEEAVPVETSNPWRTRSRPDSLRLPDTPYARKRSPATDDVKSIEAPPPARRRERPPTEEYVPSTFSTNRWRIRPKEEKEEKPSSDDYLPSTFSTNRWARPRPKEDAADTAKTPTDRTNPSSDDYRPSSFSTNRWQRTRLKDDAADTTKAHTERKTSAPEDYRPSSFSTNRWARPGEDKAERKTSAPEQSTSSLSTFTSPSSSSSFTSPSTSTSFSSSSFSTPSFSSASSSSPATATTTTTATTSSSTSSGRWRSRPKEEDSTTTDTSRRTSTEENKWRTRPKDDTKDTPFGVRVRPTRKVEEAPSIHPFARRRESRDTKSEIPFYLRKTEDPKPSTTTSTSTSLGRNRWGASSSSSSSSTPASSSLSSSSSSTSTSASSSKPSGETTFHSRFLRSSGASSSPYTSSRFGSVRESSLTRSSLPRSTAGSYLSRYGSPADSSSSRAAATTTSSSSSSSSRAGGEEGRASSPAAARKSLRYGTAATSSGSNLLALSSSSFGLTGGSGSARATPRRDAATPTGSRTADRYSGTTTSTTRYGSSGTTPGSTSASRYGSSSSSSRYGSAGSGSSLYGGTSGVGTSSRYGGASSSLSNLPPTPSATASRYSSRGTTDTLGGAGRYTSSGASSGTSRYTGDASRASGMSPYTSTSSGGSGQASRYGLSASSRYSR
ncbi:mucin-5AC-like isoform X2 [Portunus trituberculatus]|uniref:mucin-5AC-like isoform X2 n=1 Tax=Portunus trituberculatus TaxID=210409 RepID=UPI001E1CFCA3|nr:mucin-5AC-like isoform X2 [Portunus trituberculatus]XP_045106866.1 mucin-5AC-like isoform X2 [Portunus trituberculatus]XP_045106867.1 mucin-5AC-like isoform X2 [Portunus trituberculatus]